MKPSLFLISSIGAVLTSATAVACPMSFYFSSNHPKKSKNDKFCVQSDLSDRSLYDQEQFPLNFKNNLKKLKFRSLKKVSKRKTKGRGGGRRSDTRTNDVTQLRKSTQKNSYEASTSPANDKFPGVR